MTLRLIINGEANPRIQLPTIPSAKLAAHRAAHEIFGAPTSHAEDLEAGFIPRPASKLIRTIAFGIIAMAATVCIGLGIELLVEVDQQIAWEERV